VPGEQVSRDTYTQYLTINQLQSVENVEVTYVWQWQIVLRRDLSETLNNLLLQHFLLCNNFLLDKGLGANVKWLFLIKSHRTLILLLSVFSFLKNMDGKTNDKYVCKPD